MTQTTRTSRSPDLIRLAVIVGLALLALAYGMVWWLGQPDTGAFSSFWPFSILGVFGALVANSTGVGGGVVFVPAFSMLRESGVMEISPHQAVGISFAIQCFGMSVGSLTWLNRFHSHEAGPVEIAHRPTLWRIVGLVLLFALPSLLVTQRVVAVDADLAFLLFKLFSIGLGAALLVQLFVLSHKAQPRETLTRVDFVALVGLAVAGGAATAMFSVGVGELLALYLFLRRFPVDICVSTAVVCSAISVLTGVVFHIQSGHLIAEILVFAAPAVMLGGFLARRLAHWLGAFRLKLGTALWIIGSSLVLLVL